ncbi:reticulon-like protein B17 [Curcuma longa]|uniref:reticulon-like protein B17 n=1 Tax=Curcuma longa TaxID=136217 RepID=UPI003D9E8476
MEFLPPPSSPPASPPTPRSSLPENPVSQFQQALPLPSPPPRRRSRRKPVAAAEVAEARSFMASAQPARRGNRGASSTASRRSRVKIRKPEEEIVGEGTTDVTRGNDVDDDVGRAKKRKRGKEKVASAETSISVPLVPNSSRSQLDADISHDDPFVGENGSFERFVELIMWKNFAKSTLCFGAGSAFFLSSCFSKDSRFSTLSASSHIGLLVASIAFVKNSISQRQKCTSRAYFQLTEDDILCVARVVLPAINTSLTKAQDIFSGDPSWTLKILPVLLLGANYGHLITFWRLLATGFFATFTLPKLYCLYTQQIHQTAENAAHWVLEAWNSCRRKKFIAASAATILWNLFSAKTRFFAAFIFIVMLRYRHQQVRQEECGNEGKELEQPEGMVVAGETPPMMQLD